MLLQFSEKDLRQSSGRVYATLTGVIFLLSWFLFDIDEGEGLLFHGELNVTLIEDRKSSSSMSTDAEERKKSMGRMPFAGTTTKTKVLVAINIMKNTAKLTLEVEETGKLRRSDDSNEMWLATLSC